MAALHETYLRDTIRTFKNYKALGDKALAATLGANRIRTITPPLPTDTASHAPPLIV